MGKCMSQAMISKSLVFIFLVQLIAVSSEDGFIFNGFKGAGAKLSLGGLGEITSEGLLRLTNYTKEGMGHGFYSMPIHLKKSSSGIILPFSTTFVFAIQPKGEDANGHGLAFAISSLKDISEAMPSQYLGIFSNGSAKGEEHIVAIEFDTVQNLDLGDIDDNHVGIDINSLKSVNSTPVSYVDDKDGVLNLTLVSGNPMQVWIDYSAMDMKLDVVISPLGVPKPKHSLLSTKLVNLSTVILDDMYVGFSASNGAATSSHYILGWSFSINGKAQDLDISQLPSLPQQGKSKKNQTLLLVALPLAAVILLLLCIGGIILILNRRKKYAEVLEEWEVEFGPHRFSYKDLFKATKGFKEENLLGAGGFGQVYKGLLPGSKMEIAVKKISHESRQGMREFVSEIVSMGRLRHRNLVQLLGYCRRQGELLLVYDFMPNGSLEKFLFDKTRPSLSWSQRFQVIKGVASGLLYLHEEWEQVVIHRDIKASNILLDSEFNAKVSDFGLARLYDHGSNPRTTRIVGTIGYLAPELSKTGKATVSTDMYAFGTFLLEVACGRRPLEVRSVGEIVDLFDMVLDCWKKGAILNATDPKLGSDYVAEEVELVLKLGLSCSHPEPTSRPSMRQVMRILEGDVPLQHSPDGLQASAAAVSYDDSFDNVVLSYPSISDTTGGTESASEVLL
ncbi:Non-specific serine/threonine protein kinase protein [Dioscorea alata]|uniref:Non-specific serine/threonine protein kinase protein n=1 Tax=Dioscorea alata TaxID=55571 RepID=A0ACB7U9J6_DIOAL|nr:Non-specific serine/threonine protein kinase protein [Dioscorea alata]